MTPLRLVVAVITACGMAFIGYFSDPELPEAVAPSQVPTEVAPVSTIAPLGWVGTTTWAPVATVASRSANTSTTTSVPATTTEPPATSTSRVSTTTSSPTTSVVPTTTPVPTTTSTTTIPSGVIHRLYGMYERNGDVLNLQMVLGLSSVDGIYGPVTRRAHIEYLGGPLAALAVFHPEVDYPVPASDTTLGELINRYFLPGDRAWARQVAFCESSAQTYDTESAVVSSALAVGWFQHLAKFWSERSEKAGVPGASPFDTEANVAVAAWLFYEGGGARHWNPSRTCWEEK